MLENSFSPLKVIVAVLSGILFVDQGKVILEISIAEEERLFNGGVRVILLISSIMPLGYAVGNIVYLFLLTQRGQYFLGLTIYGAI